VVDRAVATKVAESVLLRRVVSRLRRTALKIWMTISRSDALLRTVAMTTRGMHVPRVFYIQSVTQL
jgi:hypothetical protein